MRNMGLIKDHELTELGQKVGEGTEEAALMLLEHAFPIIYDAMMAGNLSRLDWCVLWPMSTQRSKNKYLKNLQSILRAAGVKDVRK